VIAQTGEAYGPQSWKFCLFQQLPKVQYWELAVPGVSLEEWVSRTKIECT